MAVKLQPILPADALRVGAFLHEHLNARVSAEQWAGFIRVPWPSEQPNAGFMLVADDDQIVGAHLAFYSERTIAGQTERFCNLAAWCVLEEHRFHSLRLLKALLAQEGYHFTDLSPSGNVIKLNERLGFEALDTRASAIPNLPWPSVPGRRRVSADPAVIERTLDGEQLALYRDHARAAAARHLVLIDGDEWCYVVFRRDRRKNLPLFASLLHVSHPEVLRRMAGRLSRHLLLRHGVAVTLAEHRIAQPPRLSFELGAPRPKMFKSDRVAAHQIDYFYSELVCVAW
ncbi:hypothetical protein C8N24_6701 [Solirubrobacter pauli]|uniref:N-acetyltransferase domain-containing protein n=1 Tax=Solirubrobacter pauli TaxID=166793 RepID=A0A660L2I9_9ACTN|nr:hypothetical protein C8N24_6701 [Solirubrobacter pauli]